MDFQAIFHGTEVYPSDPYWKFSVLIESPLGTCSATLISERHALTAAHCKVYLPGDLIFFSSTHSRIASRKIVKFHEHQKHNPSQEDAFNYDIAIVEFGDGLPTREHHALPLLSSVSNLKFGDPIIALGSGLIGINDQIAKSPGIYLSELQIYSMDSRDYSIFSLEDPMNLQGICPGDSGGAGIFNENGKLVLAGVIVRALPPEGCVAPRKAHLIATPDFLPWIRETIEK